METGTRRSPRLLRLAIKALLAIILVFVCLVVAFHRSGKRIEYHPRPVSPVSSAGLARTTIVPTLDTPLAESGNAIWCATFQVAWNHMCDDVLEDSLLLSSNQTVADRLNNSAVNDSALPPNCFYAKAGRASDGIGETIRREMNHQFPGAQVPDFGETSGLVAYSYLNTKAEFTPPFADASQPIEFSDSSDAKHLVEGFGLVHGGDWSLLTEQTAQVKVLFSQSEPESMGTEPFAFALDLTADQSEEQVIVAVLPRLTELRATLDDLKRRATEFAPGRHDSRLHEIDILAIPNIAFHIAHEFAELQGKDKTIETPGPFYGQPLTKAAQSIRFRLDRSGAIVVSESEVAAAAIPRRFVVDRPFLVVMKRRSCDQPYFVAWIDNAELLEAASEPGNQSLNPEPE